MLAALIGLLIFLFVATISGTLAMPSQDELLLLLSSAGFLVFTFLYTRERRKEEEKAKTGRTLEEEKKTKNEK